jgi:3-oxoacyl-[acyl-carrier-protein] synthase II
VTETDRLGRPRVAVTGMGVKTPAGCDLDTFWARIREARSTAGPIRRFDTSTHPVKFACEVEMDVGAYLTSKDCRRSDRVTHLGLAAALDAVAGAGVFDADPGRCGVVAGTGVGGLETLEEQQATFLARGAERVSPFLVPMMMANATAATVAMHLSWTGPNVSVATACAAGSHAIGEGTQLIRSGAADVVLAGGAEAAVTPLALAAFWRMGALSRHAEPARASRPFDRDRDGFVMGEGGAFVVLERLDRALARGARLWGEVAGYGATSDAFHITAPSPAGEGAVACMELAMADAGITPAGVGHVNAHGTSTPLNDEAEAAAIAKVFGDHGIPVTATKGVTGHLIGAAGAAEAVASFLALAHQVIPPTANHEHRDPELAVDVVSGSPRQISTPTIVSNSFGFGGHNAALVLSAIE